MIILNYTNYTIIIVIKCFKLIINLANLGELCTQSITSKIIILCGNLSTCINERCTCIPPMYEENGKCVPKIQNSVPLKPIQDESQKLEVGW